CNAMLPTSASMPPFRGRHAHPRTLELKIVSDSVRRDVARRPIDAATIARRRSAEIETLDRRARSRQQRMGAIDAELRRDIGAHAHCAAHHVDIEAFDVERRKQELRSHVAIVEIGCVFAPHTKHALRVVVSLAVPVIRVAIDCVRSKRPPKGRVAVGRGISWIDRAVAGAVPHQYVRKFTGGAMFEAAAYLLDVIHAEKDIERAVDVTPASSFKRTLTRLLIYRAV